MLRLLDPRSDRAGHDHFNLGHPRGEAAVTTEQRDGGQPQTPRLLQGGENILRTTRAAQADENITGLTEGLDLPGEGHGEIIIVADRSEETSIHPEGQRGVGSPVADEATDKFRRDMGGVGRTPPIAANQQLAPGGQGGQNGVRSLPQRRLERRERLKGGLDRGEGLLEVCHGEATHPPEAGAKHPEAGRSGARQFPVARPFDIRSQNSSDASMKCRSGLLLAVLLAASCTTAPKPVELAEARVLPLALDQDFEFRKVKRFINQPETFTETPNEVIIFERRQINYGALSAEERKQREGTYFDIWWRAGRAADLTVRLEYRQARLGNDVRAQETSYTGARGTVKTSFAVIGDSYHWDGPVTAWRCLLIENGRIVAVTQSFLWK